MINKYIYKLDFLSYISMVKKGEDGFIKKKAMTKAELEEVLLNNFVNLQGVLTNLSVKFEDLSNNISRLLELFEISAKTFAEKHLEKDGPKNDKELISKLDSLLDQNKTIAKGIMQMESRIKQRDSVPKIGMRIQKSSQFNNSPPIPQPSLSYESPKNNNFSDDQNDDNLNEMIKSKPLPNN